MSKSKTLVVTKEGELNGATNIDVEIKAAKIKDSICNYSYELISGVNEGDILDRKGTAIVHEDMIAAFQKLNVHLALLCEQISGIDEIEPFENIDLSIDHEKGTMAYEVAKYKCQGFSLEGNSNNVKLFGTRRLQDGDTINLKTNLVEWEGDYQFINELRVCTDDCIAEVEAYMNGKCAPKYDQTEMNFGDEDDSE